MKKIIYLSLVGALAIIIASCSSTRISGSWKNGDIGDKKYGKIMITALTANAVVKANVEESMAERLVSRGVNAKGAGGVFNPKMEINDEMKHQVASELKSEGFEGLLTFALISEEEKTTHVPGTTYTPYASAYYGNYWGYYGYYAPQVYSSGYYTTSKVYLVEAVMYDVETEKMVWAARSETTDPSSLDKFASDFTSTIAYQLQKDEMLK
ncbi:MAG: hypothetical protein ABR574_04905 [Cryomorphaceae bacterium]|nr:hypothetical protein [Flavobacteriales bacterium]